MTKTNLCVKRNKKPKGFQAGCFGRYANAINFEWLLISAETKSRRKCYHSVSCKNSSKGIIFTVFKKKANSYCDKHSDFGKVINTWNDDQLNVTQKIQHTFQCITSTKCNGWKSSVFILQNLLMTTNPENVSSIGQILLNEISFSKAKITRFEKTSFKIMVTEIVKIKLRYLSIRIP